MVFLRTRVVGNASSPLRRIRDPQPARPEGDPMNDSQKPGASDQPAGPGGTPPTQPAPVLNPGDEAAPGSPGTGETFCPDCGGSGTLDGGPCAACGGTGNVTVGIGGA
jgi:hypothetical protein